MLPKPQDRQFTIRAFTPQDRPAVRRLCCATGFLGNPIDPIFEDLELFADYLTAYYTDWEPESSFVLEVDGEIRGYLLGSRHPLRQQFHGFYQNLSIFFRGMLRYRGYGAASRRFVRWIFLSGWREVPAAPRRTAHFHINLLEDARGVATTRALMQAYMDYLKGCGVKRVYGQMVVFQGRRGTALFERYGFRVLNRSEITKYRHLHPHPVYLCTVVKDLEQDHAMVSGPRLRTGGMA